MNQLLEITRAAERLRSTAEPFLVATVVRVRGSSYRLPGARMIVTRDRWVAGSVSAGCIERDLVRRGFWRARSGAPELLTYEGSEDGARAGTGCNGTIDVLLEPDRACALDPMGFLVDCRKSQRRGALATLFGGTAPLGAHVAVDRDGVVAADPLDADLRNRVAEDCRHALETGASMVVERSPTAGYDALVEAVLPPVRLFVVGAGHDAIPVVTFARAVGWEVLVYDASPRFETRERFASADAILFGGPEELAACVQASDRALALVMSHDYLHDRACLQALIGTRAQYIGMLGPRRRTARMFDELGMGAGDERVHAPVGLAIGAESPEEIALSIVAEAQRVLTHTSGVPLREGTGSIHASAPDAGE